MMQSLHERSSTTPAKDRPGKYSHVGGMWLEKPEDGGAQWDLRVTAYGSGAKWVSALFRRSRSRKPARRPRNGAGTSGAA